MEKVGLFVNSALTNSFRYDELEGRKHLVVNCAMLGEAVVKGSGGEVFYPKEVIANNPSKWDGMPIVVYHPKKNGKFVSARNPTFFNSRKVGVIFNTKFDDKLRTECWFDEERTKSVDSRIYEAIVNNQGTEVSTGVTVDYIPEEGEFGAEKYKKRAVDLLPDHLAILPDQIGAFSRAMGGGLFANTAVEPEGVQTVLGVSALEVLKRIGVELVGNELSFDAISRQLADLLASTYGDKGHYWRGWIQDVFPDYVVFFDKDKTWKVGYTTKSDVVSLSGEAKEVTRSVTYALVTNQKDDTMAFDKAAHIKSLIGNGWDESDRPFLESMDDTRLQRILPKATPIPAATPVAIPPVTQSVVANTTTPARPLTVNEYLADPTVPAEIRSALSGVLARDKQYKDQLVQKILAANQSSGFTAEFLGTKEIPELEGWVRLAESVTQASQAPAMFQPGFAPPNYRGAAGTPPMIGNAAGAPELDAPLGVPDFTFTPPNKL